MAEKFYIDGMTVNEIMDIDYGIINNMNKRELSRVIRTLSLAANKRVKRLKENRADIAEDALNWLEDQGYKRKKFGSKNKTVNEMRQEFLTVRQFLGMKTSTVRGAASTRKNREQRIMGYTREEAVRRERSKYISQYMENHAGRAPSYAKIKEKMNEALEKYLDMSSDAWRIYRQTLEAEGWPNSPYVKYHGSDEVIALIGKRVASGEDQDSILEKAMNKFEDEYKKNQDEMRAKEAEEDNGLKMKY